LEEGAVDQCSILYVNPGGCEQAHTGALRDLGFSVEVLDDLPPTEILTRYHAVVVRVEANVNLTLLGTRLRAKPRFGRRVLIALVPAAYGERQRRDATASGFDAALDHSCTARDLAAHILRRLRIYPEYRCLLRAPQGRRKAA
jgi:hypothetical protein